MAERPTRGLKWAQWSYTAGARACATVTLSFPRSLPIVIAALVVAALASSCDRQQDSSPAGGAERSRTDAAHVTLVERSLSHSMERGRFAFRPGLRSASLESGGTGWYARAEPDALYFVPAASSAGELPPGGLRLLPAIVDRGSWSWTPGVPFAADATGGLGRTHMGVREWVRGEAAGVEQGWTFASLPPGEGDLRVSVGVEGATLVKTDDRGLLLDTAAGRVRYGLASWIDAEGVRTTIRPLWHGGRVRIEVPGDLLQESAYPAVLDPVIGPELETDPPVVGPDAEGGSGTTIACTPNICAALYNGPQGVLGIRFDPNGALLDALPVPIPGISVVRDLTVLGNQLIVLYGSSGEVNAQRFDEALSAIGPAISVTNNAAYPARVACSSDRCLVTWKHSPNQLRGMRFDASGAVLDPVGFVIATMTFSNVAVASNGSGFLVGWDNEVARIDASGAVLDPAGLLVGHSVEAIASDGVDWLSGGNTTVRKVFQDGTLGSSVAVGGAAEIVWSGDRYLVAISATQARGISAAGATLGGIIDYGLGVTGVAAARPGGGAFWSAAPFALNPIPAIRVDATGVQQGGVFWLNTASNQQYFPTLIAGPDQYLLVYADRRLGAVGLYAQRFDSQGGAIDPIPAFIRPLYFSASEPPGLSGAFNGTIYLVAGRGTGPLSGRANRLTTDLQNLDGNGVTLSSTPNKSSVTWDGSNFMVASAGSVSVIAQRVSPSGAVFPGLSISGNDGVSSAFDGTNHRIVYIEGGQARHKQVTPGGIDLGPAELLGNTVKPPRIACDGPTCLISNGELHAAIPPGSVQVNSVITTQAGASMAFDGTEFLLVTKSPSSDPAEIFGSRFSSSVPPAQIGDWFSISQTPTEAEDAPAVAAIGDGGALVAYERYVPAENATRVFLRAIALKGPIGAGCVVDEDCSSDHCADGVCCDQACGGNDQTDCQACSVAAGAAADGQCGPLATGTICRATAGDCDVPESCDGTNTACPGDEVVPSGALCRAAAGPCDEQELCDGAGAACPPDAKKTGTSCRMAAGQCDQEEFCDGVSDACPGDAREPQGTVCRAAQGACDPEEVCDGVAVACPPDALAAAGVTCRASAGNCDIPEACDGAEANCPPDQVLAAGVECRPASGACDQVELCDGEAGACPADALAAAGTVCRPAAGPCDVEEACSGLDVQCPQDLAQPDGTPCGDEGGAAPSGGGAAPSGGGAAASDGGDAGEAGCSCSTHQTSSAPWWSVALVTGVWLVRRRRARIGRAP